MTLQLPLVRDPYDAERSSASAGEFEDELRSFCDFGTSTIVGSTPATLVDGSGIDVPTYVNEFWTSKQRAYLHYRYCFQRYY